MGSKERRERAREKMRENILNAAIELFLEHGIKKTTIRRIADKIEYTPGNIYTYFKNKNEIIYAIHQRGFQILYDMQMTVVDTRDPGERLVKLGQVYIQFALMHRPFYDLMFIESHVQKVILDEKHWEEGQNSYGILRETVSDCIQSGALPHGDVDSVTFAMWSFAHGLVSLVVRGRCAMIPDEIMPQVLRSGFAYINTGLLERNDIPAMLRTDAFQTTH